MKINDEVYHEKFGPGKITGIDLPNSKAKRFIVKFNYVKNSHLLELQEKQNGLCCFPNELQRINI